MRMDRSTLASILAFLAAVSMLSTFNPTIAAVEPQWTYDVYGTLWEVGVSGDGNYVVAGDTWYYVYGFDGNGNLMWEYETDGTIYGVAITEDGRYSVAASDDGKVYFFDQRTGDVLWTHDFLSPVLDAYISLNGRYVVAGLSNGDVYLLDSNGNVLWSYSTGDGVMSVALSRDGYYVGVASADGYIYLLNKYGDLLWKESLTGMPESIAISPEGDYIAVGDGYYYVYLFDKDGDLLWKYETGDDIWGISVSSYGKYITAGADKIYVFSKDGSVVWTYDTGDLVRGISVSPNGNYIVAGDDNERVYYFYLPESALTRGTTTILGHQVTIEETVSSTEKSSVTTNETASVEYQASTIIQKITVNINGRQQPGYLIQHNVSILSVRGNPVAFRTIISVDKNLAYSTDDMIIPSNAIILQRDPVIALDIKDPQSGDNAQYDVIVLTQASESEFVQGIQIEHQVIVQQNSPTQDTESDKGSTCGPAGIMFFIIIPAILLRRR
ncbi:WD40 repeat domain-containing protein [Thermococcus sp. LS1]|uniref:WD40 repeat domain-containing protein n=1 Tax=Thermococcus sp. LS1 TaxID=1638259 RepID=UPI001F10AF56|nr:PQQ-binding-like beta-propeller repeat protein [Thermococcus sp. LS1]